MTLGGIPGNCEVHIDLKEFGLCKFLVGMGPPWISFWSVVEFAKVPPPQRSFSIGSDVSALARAAAACQAGFVKGGQVWSTWDAC